MNARFSVAVRSFSVKPSGLKVYSASRPYSQQVRPSSEHYSIVQDVSFVKPPFAQSYGSSWDADMDASLAVSKDPLNKDHFPATSMINSKPWKIRLVVPEHDCQIITEKRTSNADEVVKATLQKGLRESDYGPAMRQSSPGVLGRLSKWIQGGVDETRPNNGEVKLKEWNSGSSLITFSDWLARPDGRLSIPILQRHITTSAGHNRALLKQLNLEHEDSIPYQSADAIIHLYSLARNLSISPLEAHLAQKWRQSFDVMPEHPHIYMWALGVLKDTSSLDDDDPLVARLVDQLAYSLLWKADLNAHDPSSTNLSTVDTYMERIPKMVVYFLGGWAPNLGVITTRLSASMVGMVRKVAEQQSLGTCDFVAADPRLIYEDFNDATDTAGTSKNS